MAEEYKSSKTKQVMDLINAKPSGVNPFLPPAEQEKEKKAKAESTIEDKLYTYTRSKRGATAPKPPHRPKHTRCFISLRQPPITRHIAVKRL